MSLDHNCIHCLVNKQLHRLFPGKYTNFIISHAPKTESVQECGHQVLVKVAQKLKNAFFLKTKLTQLQYHDCIIEGPCHQSKVSVQRIAYHSSPKRYQDIMNASETLCVSGKSQLVLCVERYTDYYFFFRKVIVEQIKSTVLGIRHLKSAL